MIHVTFKSPNHLQDIEALEKYSVLHEKGILSDDEFIKKKKEILGI